MNVVPAQVVGVGQIAVMTHRKHWQRIRHCCRVIGTRRLRLWLVAHRRLLLAFERKRCRSRQDHRARKQICGSSEEVVFGVVGNTTAGPRSGDRGTILHVRVVAADMLAQAGWGNLAILITTSEALATSVIKQVKCGAVAALDRGGVVEEFGAIVVVDHPLLPVL